jgi:hypothetical protein
MANSLLTESGLRILLEALAQVAGRKVGACYVMGVWNAQSGVQDFAFELTDTRGTHFSGRVPGSWRALNVREVGDRLVEKYPLAFAVPKEDKVTLVRAKIDESIEKALAAINEARESVIALREATKE